MKQKRVLIICGTGIATSTVVADKVRNHLASKGIAAQIEQTKVSEVLRGAEGYDVIVSTTQVPSSVTTPVVQGLPFLTGVGVEQALQEVERVLAERPEQ